MDFDACPSSPLALAASPAPGRALCTSFTEQQLDDILECDESYRYLAYDGVQLGARAGDDANRAFDEVFGSTRANAPRDAYYYSRGVHKSLKVRDARGSFETPRESLEVFSDEAQHALDGRCPAPAAAPQPAPQQHATADPNAVAAAREAEDARARALVSYYGAAGALGREVTPSPEAAVARPQCDAPQMPPQPQLTQQPRQPEQPQQPQTQPFTHPLLSPSPDQAAVQWARMRSTRRKSFDSLPMPPFSADGVPVNAAPPWAQQHQCFDPRGGRSGLGMHSSMDSDHRLPPPPPPPVLRTVSAPCGAIDTTCDASDCEDGATDATSPGGSALPATQSQRRLDRNIREQFRSSQISQQIEGLRQLLAEAGVPVKASKASILLGTVHYIRDLQRRHVDIEQERQRIMAEMCSLIGRPWHAAPIMVKAEPKVDSPAAAEAQRTSEQPQAHDAGGMPPAQPAPAYEACAGRRAAAAPPAQGAAANGACLYAPAPPGGPVAEAARSRAGDSAFDDSALPMADVSLDGRFLRVNDRFVHASGFSRDELAQITIFNLTAPGHLHVAFSYISLVLRGLDPASHLFVCAVARDGGLAPFALACSLVAVDGRARAFRASLVPRNNVPQLFAADAARATNSVASALTVAMARS
ncbi:hypothetical protein M885DRAFT_525615 [Pelagophyceae sp. CCMP2097]|nr:hypothetical protein M885DRAFT_525615 [Pelagophyceae sp. CCMP2097]